jgi:hypothetical protein
MSFEDYNLWTNSTHGRISGVVQVMHTIEERTSTATLSKDKQHRNKDSIHYLEMSLILAPAFLVDNSNTF